MSTRLLSIVLCSVALGPASRASNGHDVSSPLELGPEPLSVPQAESERPWRFGAELQLYPAGVIGALHAQHKISDRDYLTLRVGYNATDRGDWGEHDEEDGGGPGLGVGWRRRLQPDQPDGWYYGARVDAWWLEIDWEDDPSSGSPGGRSGSTDVIVLQPTAEGGYSWELGSGHQLQLGAALGAEINVDTDGEDVGEGAIFLLGLTYTF